MAKVHRYVARCSWEGSTGEGYRAYDRTHRVAAPPAREELTLSADPAFRGDAALLNPEQLLVAAASSCQLLSFLALAARERLEVLRYDDDAEGEMPEDDRPLRITTIVLRPRVVVADGSDLERARELIGLAHEQCFIANSLTSEVRLEPTLAVASGEATAGAAG